MSHQWFWALILVGIFAVMIYYFSVATRESTGGFVDRYFVCPYKKMKVHVVFLLDFLSRSKYKDVTSCSAFQDPKKVTCEKKCLGLSEKELGKPV